MTNERVLIGGGGQYNAPLGTLHNASFGGGV